MTLNLRGICFPASWALIAAIALAGAHALAAGPGGGGGGGGGAAGGVAGAGAGPGRAAGGGKTTVTNGSGQVTVDNLGAPVNGASVTTPANQDAFEALEAQGFGANTPLYTYPAGIAYPACGATTTLGMYNNCGPTPFGYLMNNAASMIPNAASTISGLCDQVNNHPSSLNDNIKDAIAASDATADDAKPVPFNGLDAARNNSDIGYGYEKSKAKFGNCNQKFFDNDHKLEPWGQALLQHIQEHDQAFRTLPRDMDSLCPGYRNIALHEPERDAFWVEFFSALAKPESSCNPGALNRNAPNGTAIGLYQLEDAVCPEADKHNLTNAYRNIDCAVDKFASELSCRGTIMINTSNHGSAIHNCGGTYWGELRLNPHGGGDTGAHEAFVNELKNFPGCH